MASPRARTARASSRRRRAARPAGGVRQRPALRLRAPALGARAAQDAAVAALERAGHPVVRIELRRRIRPGAGVLPLGDRRRRWPARCSGINPFNQPDVEAAKVAARKLTADYESTGTLPAETPFSRRGRSRCSPTRRTPPRSTGRRRTTGASRSCAAHLGRLTGRLLRAARLRRDERGERARAAGHPRSACATRGGWRRGWGSGPRFLHSTGQGYKGGPDSGVFLQITCDDARDLPVPGQTYTFGVVKAAQAGAISRCWPSATGVRCGCTWDGICRARSARYRPRCGQRSRSEWIIHVICRAVARQPRPP